MDVNNVELLLVPVIISLSEMIKKAGFPVTFIPLVNICLGIAGAYGVMYNNDILQNIVIKGLMIGLTASGLYSGTKSIVNGVKNGNNNDASNL